MTEVVTNRLATARSAYLRSAMHQPVEWNEWGSAAFSQAQDQDKPILLDIGAVWCHWCHVMDRESYENAETAEIINKFFVAVKVDRDERPDVDSRYQAAAAAISGQGGWPLTAFLTPDGKPYFAGTYFPPVDAHGRPSFRRVLFTMAEAFQKKRGEVDESAASVMAAIEQNETFDGSAKDPGEPLVRKVIEASLSQFDPRYGGFGSQPKFPNSGALDLLIDEAGRAGNQDACRTAALTTLEKMANGGIYDHLAGGFHRYSVDERWVVPHFEKMSYDNSELLRNYVHAYRQFGEAACARVARAIVAWIDECMSDRERGGFYASQDADFSLDDDGDYFTWTRAEAAAVLTEDELKLAESYFDIGPIGDMHHNFEKNTLHIDKPLDEVARSLGMPVELAAASIKSAKTKLYAARKLRPTPCIDKTVYTNWNSMMISAYLEAGRVLGIASAVEFALKTLDRILATLDGTKNAEGAELGHVVSYGEGDGAGEDVPGGLEDYVFTGHAALDAWEATGEMRHFEGALKLGQAAVAKFYDFDKGGFFDTEVVEGGLGVLAARRKPLQDAPSPGGNPVAAALMVRLAELTGDSAMQAKAKATLESFAGIVEHFGMHCATYALALRRLALPPVQVVVVGADTLADGLERIALKGYSIEKSVVRLRQTGPLPPSLAETIPKLPAQDGSFAVVCIGLSCQPPVRTVAELAEVMNLS